MRAIQLMCRPLGSFSTGPVGLLRAHRQVFVGHVEIVNGQRELPHLVGALHAAGRFAGGLNRRQQERDQDADDRDHDQELDERECGARWERRERFMIRPPGLG